MKALARRLWPAITVMSLIFIASSMPGSELPKFGSWDIPVKKGGHMVGYALLAAAYLYAISNLQRIKRIQFVVAFCLTILYAATDEWHQGFTPGRIPSFLDIAIDGAGGLIGLLLWHIIRTEAHARYRAPRDS